MQKNNKNSQGYILVLTMMIISIMVLVVTQMFYQGTAHLAFSRTVINTQKAKMLSLGGLQLTISKLSVVPKKEAKKPEQTQAAGSEQKPQKDDQGKKLLKKLLPIINRWQTINLKESIEGVEGQIKICITCENGKININKLYDYANHKFLGQGQTKGDTKKVLEQIFKKLEDITGKKNMFYSLQQFLQKRKYPLNDITELLEIADYSYFKDRVFYEPIDQKGKSLKDVYLTDIFTTWTEDAKIQPWLFSDSLCGVLGLRRVEGKDFETRKQSAEQWIENFKPKFQPDLDWSKIFKPIYNKDLSGLPKDFDTILDTQFAPNIFSVISSSIVDNVAQNLFAILQIQKKGDSVVVKLKKLYWI